MKSLFHASTCIALATVVLIACGATTDAADKPNADKPNIVIIYADDMGWGDVGYHGVDDILTPNIDRLAAEGVHFTQGYVSASVCGPSRAGLMTGVYQQRLGAGENPNTNGFPDDPRFPFAGLTRTQPILSEMLQPLGYRCGMIGKWHLGLHETMRPNARGFDYYYGFLNGAHSYEEAYPVFGKNKGLWPLFRNNEMQPEYYGYLTDTFSDEAVAFIERNADEPFFLYVAYNAVHHPWQVPDQYLERTKHLSDIEDRRFFAGMVLAMDDGVGRIMRAIEQAGVSENTLVLFISDNGSPRGQGLDHPPKDYQKERGGDTMSNPGPFRGFKGDTFEGGIRVPFVMRWPGKIRPGTRYDLPVSNLDVVPTVLGHFGRTTPTKGFAFDGVDLMPYLRGQRDGQRPHDVMYWRRDDDYAIRRGDWKLAWNDHSVQPGSGAMLFNLADDPGEYRDLSDELPELKQELQEQFDAWDCRMPPSPYWGGPINRKPNPDAPAPPADTSQERPKQEEPKAPSLEDIRSVDVSGRSKDGAIILTPPQAVVHGQAIQQERDVLSHWREPNEWAEWSFESPSAGLYEIVVEYAAPHSSNAVFTIGDQRIATYLPARRNWGDAASWIAGRVRLDANRRYTLAMKPGEDWRAVNVRTISLYPLLPEGQSFGGDRPNIVLVMADDMGYECLGSYGCTEYATPVLDRLASEGLKFNNCHAQPLCTPSRVQIMTGRYNNRNYIGFGTLETSEVTFGNVLRQAGYATCIAGKWQLDFASGRVSPETPNHFGFDEHCLWFLYDHTKQPQGRRYWEPYSFIENGQITPVAEDAYGPDLFCDYVEDFIERKSKDQEPFFVYYPMALTHAPFVPTPDSDSPFEGYGQADYKNDRYMKDMVEYTDDVVGRLIDCLEVNGVRENTLFIFTGDNGTDIHVTTDTRFGPIQGGKALMTDGGTHVPMVVSWPRQRYQRHTCDDLVDFSDFLPTLAEAAGAPMPQDRAIDGVSFLPQLRGEGGKPRDWVFCHYWGHGRKQSETQESVRTLRWKLYDDGRFHDLASDILEQSPLQELTPEARQAKQQLENAFEEVRSAQ